MSEKTIPVNRTLVGILALACFACALGIWWMIPPEEMDGDPEMWLGGFVRVGLLMSAFWLALPTSNRQAAWANISPWTFVGLILAVLLTIKLRLKVVLPLFAVLTVMGLLLRPKAKKRPKR